MARPEAAGQPGVQRILRLPAVLDATGWSRSTLYAKIADEKFPSPIKLDPEGRAVGWLESDVLAHQAACISARTATEAA